MSAEEWGEFAFEHALARLLMTDVLRVGKSLNAKVPKLRGSRNPKILKAIQEGREQHRYLRKKVSNKEGWKSELRIKDPITGDVIKSDIITPNGRPIELKPRTETGIKTGREQIEKYKTILGKRGKVIFYVPKDKD